MGSVNLLFERSSRELTSKKANCFIFSLALSDLCSGLVSPIGIYIKTWGFNPFYWPSAFCNVSSIFLIPIFMIMASSNRERPRASINLKLNSDLLGHRRNYLLCNISSHCIFCIFSIFISMSSTSNGL